MEKSDKITLTAFESRERHRKNRRRRNPRRDIVVKRRVRGASMGVKIAICLGIVVLAVLVRVVEVPYLSDALYGISASNDESENEDSLGELRFVEMPPGIEVFSPSNAMSIPIDYTTARLDESELKLTLKGVSAASVMTSASGVVKSVGADDAYGAYVVVRHDGDIEVSYYGLSVVSVEESQVLEPRDTLGILNESGNLTLTVTESGAPKNPTDYYRVTLTGQSST